MKYVIVDGSNWFIRNYYSGATATQMLNDLNLISLQHPMIIVWDGRNTKKVRQEIFPEYKMNRVKKEPDTLMYRAKDMIQELSEYIKHIQIRVDGYEADDVISDLTKELPIEYIETNDGDMKALGVPLSKDSLPLVTPKDVRLYKTLVGDSSDNIPGLKGFGKASWGKLSEEQKLNILKALEAEDKELLKCKEDKIYLGFNTLLPQYKVVGFFKVPSETVSGGTKAFTARPKELINTMKERHIV